MVRKRRERSSRDILAEKEALYADLEAGVLTLGQATRRMRKIIGVTQTEYAVKVLKIYPRVLMDLENDRGNPTLETLEKVAKPFGLKVSFIKSKATVASGEVTGKIGGTTHKMLNVDG